MLDLIRSRFENESVVLLGFGREGQASYTVLRRVFPKMLITIADAKESVCENPLIREDKNLNFITGEGYLKKIISFDIIVRSPGIPIWNSPLSHHLTSSRPHPVITSQTDLFLQAYARQVIGVTGTKGKSTTSSLIHHILKTADKDTVLVGNIGNPAFHYIDLIGPETKIVFELSSHQLEYVTVAPKIAILLNLFQEHLDAYSTFEAYQQAKINITRYQENSDILIFNADDPLVINQVTPFFPDRNCYPFSVFHPVIHGGFIKDGFLYFATKDGLNPVWKIHQDRYLSGEHNLKNILASVIVAMILGVSQEDIEDGIATFKGLEHRLEYVGEYGAIHFYNDSIATIPEACMEAVKAIPKVDTLIAGGFDRGIDYSGLAQFLCSSSVRNLILLGAAGKRIGEQIEKLDHRDKKLFYINRFDNFKDIAFRETWPGYACLLSPAAASYDEFRNFEERGIRFRELVGKRLEIVKW
ncbi:MAG: UDP-N-acetylmuramoyl-L-alanine--D-glutamate ligase [Bacteroidales bacterium]|jgi:UDP-N-acetylmuramoylalanine--D-glutamate ligase|nr:UDP-N-acetylmuramoyl-L-alanine--D-glutamate ligase [Bacteroidales bacterium]